MGLEVKTEPLSCCSIRRFTMVLNGHLHQDDDLIQNFETIGSVLVAEDRAARSACL
jgi:hypothetical protein